MHGVVVKQTQLPGRHVDPNRTVAEAIGEQMLRQIGHLLGFDVQPLGRELRAVLSACVNSINSNDCGTGTS